MVTAKIRWVHTLTDCVKLNVDGPVNHSLLKAGAGEVLRDNNGTWLGGFSYLVCHCEVFQAKL